MLLKNPMLAEKKMGSQSSLSSLKRGKLHYRSYISPYLIHITNDVLRVLTLVSNNESPVRNSHVCRLSRGPVCWPAVCGLALRSRLTGSVPLLRARESSRASRLTCADLC